MDKIAMPVSLPEQFKDLEPYTEWALPTMTARLEKRLASSYESVKAYYDVMLPRIEEILGYLNQFPLNDMPEAEQNLMNMALAFADAISCVEYYRSTRIPKGVEHERFPLVPPSCVF
jgi:hypothetical protein